MSKREIKSTFQKTAERMLKNARKLRGGSNKSELKYHSGYVQALRDILKKI